MGTCCPALGAAPLRWMWAHWMRVAKSLDPEPPGATLKELDSGKTRLASFRGAFTYLGECGRAPGDPGCRDRTGEGKFPRRFHCNGRNWLISAVSQSLALTAPPQTHTQAYISPFPCSPLSLHEALSGGRSWAEACSHHSAAVLGASCRLGRGWGVGNPALDAG